MKRIKPLIIALAIALPALPASAASLFHSDRNTAVVAQGNSNAQVHLASGRQIKRHLRKKAFRNNSYDNRRYNNHRYSSRHGYSSGHRYSTRRGYSPHYRYHPRASYSNRHYPHYSGHHRKVFIYN